MFYILLMHIKSLNYNLKYPKLHLGPPKCVTTHSRVVHADDFQLFSCISHMTEGLTVYQHLNMIYCCCKYLENSYNYCIKLHKTLQCVCYLNSMLVWRKKVSHMYVCTCAHIHTHSPLLPHTHIHTHADADQIK